MPFVVIFCLGAPFCVVAVFSFSENLRLEVGPKTLKELLWKQKASPWHRERHYILM